MSESFSQDQSQDRDRPSDPVDAVTARALTVVATRVRGAHEVAPRHVDMLVDAAQAEDRGALAVLSAQMIGAGIRAEDIADHYLPEAARKLGAKWCDDTMGFVAVTVGSARLMSLLRELGPEWRADRSAAAAGHAVLVVVAAGISHTLGATVLTGQLRRRGISVRLLVGARPDDLGPLLRQMQFDAVMLSASLGESLGTLRRLVDAMRMAMAAPPPIVLGGTITTTEGLSPRSIREQTGVDLVTNDPGEALARCGLTVVGPDRLGRGPGA